MTKRTGDEPTKIQSIDPNVDTKIFTPEQKAYQTNKVSDPTPQPPDPFSYHVKMFEREIQALARLKHPGIASIYESGRSDDGQIFFAMELIRGISPLFRQRGAI